MAVNIAHDDALLTYLGRWQHDAGSSWSGWQGAQVRFKVSGTLNLDVNVNVVDASGSDITGVIINIDGGDRVQVITTDYPTIYTGAKTAHFAIPDTGEHAIVMKIYAYPTLQWTQVGQCRLTSIDIDNGGTFSAWGRNGGILAGFVGDSWMATSAEWPSLLSWRKYWTYMLSYGGARASTLDAKIDYDYDGQLNTDDPTLDAIIVNSSVNDYNAGVSLSAFNASFASVVDKLRTQHSDAKIILLQSPRNTTDSKNFDQYGPEMSSIASARSNVEYISITSAQWSTYTWSDPSHLDYASRQALASYYEDEIDKLIPFKRLSKGQII